MVTVNLTTTFQRLYLCKITLLSLVLQSLKPCKIRLWISKEPYLSDSGIEDASILDDVLNYLPEDFRDLIEIHFVPNTGPYRKLIPALRLAVKGEIIVTADDDQFYGENWLKRLVAEYKLAGGPVAARVRQIKRNRFGKRTSYLYWDIITTRKVVSDDYVITFGGGAVLDKVMFQDCDIFDDGFVDVSPTADDLWFSKLLRRSQVKVMVASDILNEITPVKHSHGLVNINFPKKAPFIIRLIRHIWFPVWGLWGGSICNNDMSFKRIESYFEGRH